MHQTFNPSDPTGWPDQGAGERVTAWTVAKGPVILEPSDAEAKSTSFTFALIYFRGCVLFTLS